ncbi:MAG: hypothetical protein HY815_16260 [Candidatus Riflebacteria bacterium]|nr:hypothetical protein [Candidatus Riflebacteria bacterium]
MPVVILGGLTTSTLLNLFLLPALSKFMVLAGQGSDVINGGAGTDLIFGDSGLISRQGRAG